MVIYQLQRLLPNPVFIFFIGFVYYLISPAFIMFFLLDEGYSQNYELLLKSGSYIDIFFFDMSYWLDLIIIFSTFYLGYRYTKTIKSNSSPIKLDIVATSDFSFYFLLIFNALVLCGLLLYAVFSGVDFFSGYEYFNIVFLGSLSTLAFLNIYFFVFFSSYKNNALFFLMFTICAIILLGLGSRNIALGGVLSFLAFIIWIKPSVIKSWWFYLILIAIPVTLISIGIWRTGYEFSFQMIVSHLFAEAMFVLSSASCYLQNIVERPIFEFPWGLIAGVVNFSPSLVFPEKANIIANLIDDSDVYSPFGASSIIVNLYSNFGYFYPFFVFILASGFTFLYVEAKRSFFFRAAYLSLFPLLMFQVFNQPLYSFLKLLVYNGLILPFIMLSFLYVIQTWFLKNKKNA